MSSQSSGRDRRERDSRFWMVPAATFLVGLLLGGLLVGVSMLGSRPQTDRPDAAAPAPSPTPTEGDVTVTVPAACVEAGELSTELLDLAGQAAGAIGDLDARALQDVVGRMQELDPLVRQAAGRCREAGLPATTAGPGTP